MSASKLEIKAVFDSLDSNKNGSIEAYELKAALTELKMYTNPVQLKKLMNAADVNHDGGISLDELTSIVRAYESNGDKTGLGRVYAKQKEVVSFGSGGGKHTYAQEEFHAFAEHLNNIMEKDDDLKYLLPIDSSGLELAEKVGDGILLSKLINLAVEDTIDERALNKQKPGKTMSVFQRNENLTLMINAATSIGAQTVNLGASDIAEGQNNPTLVLGLVWQLVRLQLLSSINLKSFPELFRLLEDGETLADLKALSAEALLLRWFNFHLKAAGSDRRVKNFSGDVKDGKAYATLLHQIAPGVCKGESLNQPTPVATATAVLKDTANLGIQSFITSRDIVKGNPKLNLAFTASIFNHLPGLDPLEVEELKELEEVELDEGDDREELAYRMWMNSLGIAGLHIDNLFAGMSDGLYLLKVIDFVHPGTVAWNKVEMKPKNKFKKVANANYAVVLGKSLEFSLVGIGGVDIVNQNKKLVLGFTWQLMRSHVLKYLQMAQSKIFGKKKVTDKMIITWANQCVADHGKSSSMKSFRDSTLSNGIFFLDLLSCVRDDAVNPANVTPGETEEDKTLNARYTISVARKLGAVVFLLPEDIVQVRPKLLLTLVGSIMACMK